jgi:hypothetical protein
MSTSLNARMGRRSLAQWEALPGGERCRTPRQLSHPGAGPGRDDVRHELFSNGAGYADDCIPIPIPIPIAELE